jgi:hypothetical protein
VVCHQDGAAAAEGVINSILSMLMRILIILGLIAFAYIKRHGFRRAWYILRTGAEKPNWEVLGGDYFLAPWERQT